MTNDFADYKKIEAVNASSLKVLWDKSAKHYKDALECPDTETDAQRFGSAVHQFILEPEKDLAGYAILPDEFPDYKTQKSRDWRDAHIANGITPLKPAEYSALLVMVKAIASHKPARDLLMNGAAEQTLQWIDPETGIKCKGRTDFITSGGILVDLKSCADIRPKEFTRQALKLGYHLSMAFYTDGLMELGRKPSSAWWICIEKKRPFDVAVYRFNDDWLELGRDEYRPALQTLAQCRLTGRYDGIAPEAVDLELPAYAYPKIVPDESTGFEIVEDEDE